MKPFRIPIATYRLQFSTNLRLADARALVGYLHDLGITDAYASPLFRAREESAHGYDVIDHGSIDPESGSEEEFRRFAEELGRKQMGLLMDVVPNHMGIDDANNRLWQDVLENGPSSPYAHFFDIDWDPPKEELKQQVLLPFLGDQYGKVLENQELALVYDAGRFFVDYYHRRFPINPRSWTRVLELARECLADRLEAEDPHRMELESILISLGNLPPPSERDPEKIHQRQVEREVDSRRLSALLEASPPIAEALQQAIGEFNGRRGDPPSFDRLEALLDEQAYRLCYWRVAADEINYRRFFDVNELAAIRVDDPDVFRLVHELVFRFIARGWVTGLRIDHPDGLLDPKHYFADLQAEFRRIGRDSTPPGSAPAGTCLYVVAEKIVGHDEVLPADWDVHGTTGYHYLNLANGLFVDRAAASVMRALYGRFTGNAVRFRDVAYESKKTILEVSMSSELHVLARRLDRISEAHRWSRDFTLSSLRKVLAEVIACFPVYRTYIRPGDQQVGDEDRRRILAALRLAKRRNPALSSSLFHFLGSVLLLEDPDGISDLQRQLRREFVLRFQQITGPVTAKGIEDTAFYRDYPLLSLAEVGGEPEIFGVSPEQFHRRNADRLEHWPHTMLASSTHDTKRSEDARARINVLSECPQQWEQAIERWREMNSRHKREIDGADAPDANEEYLLYQTLVGTWPLEPISGADREQYTARIVQFMAKALKEAKLNTSWMDPHEEHEKAVEHFVRSILDPAADSGFLADFEACHAPLALAGMHNALAQVLLKTCAPGVPDFYQGTELWDFSLVDPDNRRPVDFHRRKRLLAEIKAVRQRPALVAELVNNWRDGRIKLFVTWQALNFRRDHRELFEQGEYLGVPVEGPREQHLFALVRRHRNRAALAVVPRLTLALLSHDQERWEPGVWDQTSLRLPPGLPGQWHNILTGEVLSSTDQVLAASEALRSFPVALFQLVH
ncbi:MAG: malto-oligosyltrehalose synthase [Pirellulales bacterium]